MRAFLGGKRSDVAAERDVVSLADLLQLAQQSSRCTRICGRGALEPLDLAGAGLPLDTGCDSIEFPECVTERPTFVIQERPI
jgi:hypothetical protein